MNAASIVILALVLGLVAFAVWRCVKKGAPCECGGSHKDCCKNGGECCCCSEQ